MDTSEVHTSVQVHSQAVGQWNEGEHNGGTPSEQSVIHIQPIPEVNGVLDTQNGSPSVGSMPGTTPRSNTSFPIEAAVTITNNSTQGNYVVHAVETHAVPHAETPTKSANDSAPVPSVTSDSARCNSNNTPMASKTEQETLTKISVEGGGQDSVVIKTEPGLEEEGFKTDKQKESQPSLGVIKAEKDSSEYETSAAKHSGKPSAESGDNSAQPEPRKEYEPGSKVCNICSRVLSSPENCVSHIANHQKEGFRMFECDTCGWAFESQMQYNVHKKKHGKGTATPSAKPSECSGTAKVSFPFKKTPVAKKTKETESDSSNASLTCLFCGRVLSSGKELKEHQQRHCDEKFTFLQCSDCDSCYESKEALLEHRKKDHNDNTPLLEHMNEAYISYACTICKRTFKTEGKLEEHTDNHSNGTNLHLCSECGFCFEAEGDLKVHRRNKHKQKYGPKAYKCPCNECSRPFKNDADMEKHLENHYNGTKLHVCSECGFAYENPATLQSHRYEKHVKPLMADKKPRQKKAELEPEVLNRSCQICERICPDEAMKDAHVLNHHSNMPMIKCGMCSWEFEDQETYAHHKETNHKRSGPGQHTCNTCQRKFKSEDKKFAHIQNHVNDVTMYKCETCPFEFEDDNECSQHELKCTKGKNTKKEKKDNWKYTCDYCDRKFQSETIKAMHMTRHLSNEPMHKCAECGWHFEQIHQMTYHLKTHKSDKKTPSKKTPRKEEKEKPNTVCDQCERQFYYERQMKTHRENHFNGSELHKCRYCPWQYEKETSLPRHVEQYHPYYAPKSEFSKEKRRSGQKFVCPICGRNFMGKVLYVQHLANHTELPYKCPYEKCGWYYSDYKQFQTHKNSKHSETKDNVKYDLEKMAEEANATGDNSVLEESPGVLNESAADPEKSISFALMCPRCKEWFSNKKELHNHTMKCKVSYTCGTCQLMFDNFNDFELHLFEDEMECEVCKTMFASECILQKHLVSKHFSPEMIDESEKQQSVVEEEKKKAAKEGEEKKKAAEEEKAKAELAKPTQPKSSPPKAPSTPVRTEVKTGINPKPATPTPTRTSTRSRTAPTHTVTKRDLEATDDQDNTCDENLVSSTVDMVDDNSNTDSSQKRKRVSSTDSNIVDSSDDPSSSKRRKLEDDKSDRGQPKQAEKKVIVCDVLHCHGAFFDEHVYMEHVRHIHSDCTNIISDDKCTTIQVKDASRTNPTQNKPGPASRVKKVWSLLRIQCQQGDCKDSSASYFTTRSLFNRHTAEVHSGKRTGDNDGSNVKNSVENKSPDAGNNPSSQAGSDAEEEPPEKKKKSDEDAIKGMMSESSYSSLLKDLDSLKKGSSDASSPAKISPGRGSSGARTSTRKKEGK